MKEIEKERREKKQQKGVKISLDLFGRRMVVTEATETNIYEPFDFTELFEKKETSVFENPTIHTKGTTETSKPAYVDENEVDNNVVKKEEKKKEQKENHSKNMSSKIKHQYFEVDEEDMKNFNEKRETFEFFGLFEKSSKNEESRKKSMELAKQRQCTHYVVSDTSSSLLGICCLFLVMLNK